MCIHIAIEFRCNEAKILQYMGEMPCPLDYLTDKLHSVLIFVFGFKLFFFAYTTILENTKLSGYQE